MFPTITAPGRDRLPDRQAMYRWNRTAPARLREMHRTARQNVVRKLGFPPNLLAWTWEYQSRGALHKHFILGAETARELAAAHEYVAELDRLRHHYGFGFVDRGRRQPGQSGRRLPVFSAETGARYAAKYVSPLSAEGKPTLSETVTREDVPSLVVYVSNKLTMKTGVTMRWLRYVRLCHVLGVDARTGEVLVLHEEISGRDVHQVVHSGPPDL